MKTIKQNTAVLWSLLFLLVAAVDTAAAGDYAGGKLSKALILDGESAGPARQPPFTPLRSLQRHPQAPHPKSKFLAVKIK